LPASDKNIEIYETMDYKYYAKEDEEINYFNLLSILLTILKSHTGVPG